MSIRGKGEIPGGGMVDQMGEPNTRLLQTLTNHAFGGIFVGRVEFPDDGKSRARPAEAVAGVVWARSALPQSVNAVRSSANNERLRIGTFS